MENVLAILPQRYNNLTMRECCLSYNPMVVLGLLRPAARQNGARGAKTEAKPNRNEEVPYKASVFPSRRPNRQWNLLEHRRHSADALRRHDQEIEISKRF